MHTAKEIGFYRALFLAGSSDILSIAGNYEDALETTTRGLTLTQGGLDRAYLLRAHTMILIRQDRIEEAKFHLKETWAMDRNVSPESCIALFAMVGDMDMARRILETLEIESSNQGYLAEGYMALGDMDGAFKAIRAGILNHTRNVILGLLTAPWWDPIRDDSRFEEILELLAALLTSLLWRHLYRVLTCLFILPSNPMSCFSLKRCHMN